MPLRVSSFILLWKNKSVAHHLYHTQAIIIGYKDTGDANRAFYLLTRELGLVLAVAQSVRQEKSKLRYHLQLGRVPTVTLVRGREIWRIVGAEAGEDISRLWRLSSGRLLIRRSFALVRKLIHGEEYNPAVFETLIAAFRYVSEQLPTISDREIELILNLRLLYYLGYIKTETYTASLIENNTWDDEVIARAKDHQSELEILIKETLLSTHL